VKVVIVVGRTVAAIFFVSLVVAQARVSLVALDPIAAHVRRAVLGVCLSGFSTAGFNHSGSADRRILAGDLPLDVLIVLVLAVGLAFVLRWLLAAHLTT